MSVIRAGAALFLCLALFVSQALAVQPNEVLADPAKEARARALSKELRCMVCQNQSIDDSDAPLARDLRVLVRERISAGDSDDAVRQFLVARYGEFVLMRPTWSGANLILWLAPFIVLVGGALAVWYGYYRRRAAPISMSMPLSVDEEARLDKVLKTEEQASSGGKITKV